MTPEWDRAADALAGRERAHLYARTPDGYAGILEEWIVPHREHRSELVRYVWTLDAEVVERFCRELCTRWAKEGR